MTRGHHSGGGFTLVEMLEVLVVLGLMAGMEIARAPSRSQRLDLDAVARRLSGTLRLVRTIAYNRPVAAHLTAGVYRLDDEVAQALTCDVRSDGDTVIAFTPNGGSTGYDIHLCSGSLRVTIQVDWLARRTVLSKFKDQRRVDLRGTETAFLSKHHAMTAQV